MPVIYNGENLSAGSPVEIAPGRGDLRTSSLPIDLWDGAGMFGDRPVSYAQMFADQSWVGIAVMRLLTWSVRVPLKVYRRTGADGERERLRPDDHPLARAVIEPWDRGSQAQLVPALLGSLLVHGNSLCDVTIGRRTRRLTFEPIDWRTISPIRLRPGDPNATIVGWKTRDLTGETEQTRSADTVMHLAWWSPLGSLGVSPLRQLGATLRTETAAVGWTQTLLEQAARPSGVVQADEKFLGLDREERQQLLNQLRADLRAAHAGVAGAGKLAVLPPGLSWTTTEYTTAVEAQLIEQRKINREEVAAVYMIPPPMIGILDRATYSNVQTAREMAYTDGLAPPLILLEQRINAHVCRGILGEPDVFVEFDFAGILRGDRLKEIQAIREAVSTAALTPNEGRDVLNLPRSDDPMADELYLPVNNLKPIRSLAGTAGATREE